MKDRFESITQDVRMATLSRNEPGDARPERLRVASLPQVLRRLRLRDLETLDRLGRYRSFARTAEAASITQPALSKWLRELEDELGFALFERTSRRVAPTVYGEAMLESVARILTDLRGIEPAFEALRRGAGQPVTVGMLPGMPPLLVPGIVDYLENQGSHIQISLQELTLDHLLPQALRHELDLVVCRLDAAALASGLASRPLYHDEVIAVAGRQHPLARRQSVSWRDAAQFPWIAPPKGSPMRAALEAEFAHAGVAMPRIVMGSVSPLTNHAVARRQPCLFVSAAKGLAARSEAEPAMHALPLALATVVPTVGVLYVEPCSAAVATMLNALEAVARSV
jgi:DNA-binding transcriptional LysR family regulator